MTMTVLVSLCFRFGLTAIYLLAIQYFTRIGGKISVKLIKSENEESTEKRADSLVYKVFSRRRRCIWSFVFSCQNLAHFINLISL